MPGRPRLLALLVLACLGPVATAHATGDLHATANANAANEIVIDWTWYEFNPEAPPTNPEWIGYDLYRRDPAQCTEWVRLNPTIIPRVPGQTHSGTFVDMPAVGITWEYQFVPVNAAREAVFLNGAVCEPPCAPHAWESIPKLAGPVTVGKVTMDIGWAVVITPCLDGCWYTFTVSEPEASLLRPYLNTGQAFRFYGDEFFGTFEGSPLYLDHFEPTTCGTVSTAPTSWGRIKTIYR